MYFLYLASFFKHLITCGLRPPTAVLLIIAQESRDLMQTSTLDGSAVLHALPHSYISMGELPKISCLLGM